MDGGKSKSATLRFGRDDRVVGGKPGKQIPYGDDNQKGKAKGTNSRKRRRAPENPALLLT
jgi:hypothetical protein